MTFIPIQKIQKIMKNTEAETKVVTYKIARDLDDTSPVVALIALTTMLIASVLHSTGPKKVADTIINSIRRAVENAEGGKKW